MYKRYEIPVLIASIFVLILILRFLFYFSFKEGFYSGQQIEIEHVLLESPDKNSFQQYFYIDNLLVTLPLFPEYSYGDNLSLKGVVGSYISKKNDEVTEKLILENPEVKIEENNVLAVLKSIRQKVLLSYKSILPPREASLISGIVLGVDDDMSENFKDELKKTGMLHVVVASGSNVVLIAGILFGLINSLVKKKAAIIFTILGIFFYAILAGFDPPIVRASIMASFAFAATLFGRQKIGLISLFFSGWFMLMISPNLIQDIGFQLSFSASFGIIMFQKIVQSIFKLIPKIIKEDFSTTLSAQIGALPFLLIAFGAVNLFSIFINVILLWTVPIIMIFGLVSAVLALISPLISQPIILLTYPFLALFSEVVRFSSNIYLPLSLNSIFAPIAVIYYVLIIYILLKVKIKK